MMNIFAILKKAFFSSIIMTVLLSIMMYLRGYPAEISFVIKYIFHFFFFSMTSHLSRGLRDEFYY